MKKVKTIISLIFLNFTILFSQSKFEPNGIIALMTDYGTKDFYVGALKGSICKINPNVKILDLTHEVKPFNIGEGMFTALMSSWEFPSGTIFLTIVDPGVGTDRRPILLETLNNKIFIGPDNGLLTLVMDKFGVKQVRELSNKQLFRKEGISKSFHGRDIFGPVAANISLGKEISDCGKEITDYVKIKIKNSEIEDNRILSEIIFIDRYGNFQVNCGAYYLQTLGVNLGDKVRIKTRSKTIECPYVSTYGDIPKGGFLVLEASTNFLEIAINEGNAEKYFNVKLGDDIEITKVK